MEAWSGLCAATGRRPPLRSRGFWAVRQKKGFLCLARLRVEGGRFAPRPLAKRTRSPRLTRSQKMGVCASPARPRVAGGRVVARKCGLLHSSGSGGSVRIGSEVCADSPLRSHAPRAALQADGGSAQHAARHVLPASTGTESGVSCRPSSRSERMLRAQEGALAWRQGTLKGAWACPLHRHC
jgi:hypothetical protein